MIIKERYILFGAGGTALKVIDLLGDSVDVIACIDNDSKKWGAKFSNHLVISPVKIHSLYYDKIAIAMLKGVNTVRQQLIKLGVPEDKIIVPLRNAEIFPNNKIHPSIHKYSELNFRDQSTKKRYIERYELLNGWISDLSKSYLMQRHHPHSTLLNSVKAIQNTIEHNTLMAHAMDESKWHSVESELNWNECSPYLRLRLIASYINFISGSSLIVYFGNNPESAIVEDMTCTMTGVLAMIRISLGNNAIAFHELANSIIEFSQIKSINKNDLSLSLDHDYDFIVFLIDTNVVDEDDFIEHIIKKMRDKSIISRFAYSKLQYDKTQISRIICSKSSLDFYCSKRLVKNNDNFFEILSEFKNAMQINNVPLESCVITSGSVLRAYGLKETDDVDVLLTSDFRELYGKGLVIISDHVEMHPVNESEIDDDELIINPNRHFWFQGVKFVNLDIIYKIRIGAKNDDARLIREFIDTESVGYSMQ